MAKYLEIAKTLRAKFQAVKIKQVGMELNLHADALASLASIFKGEIGQTVIVDVISTPNHKNVSGVHPNQHQTEVELDGPNCKFFMT